MYMCIDLKSFFASVECVMIGKDPMEYPLVVADASRGQGALCLAVSPALRKFGVKNRCRLFEIPDALYYDIAKPKMKKYIEYSGRIYQVYLRYFAKEDILPYSIDEMFIDISGYQKLYKKEPTQLAKEVIDDIMEDTGITATAGVGTNMFLAKIAMDLIAKKNESHIGYLDEELFREKLWQHRPITDFWQIGKGIARRLEARGLTCLEDVAHYPEKYLYKEFGINARYLIDHAWGRESATMEQIKGYEPQTHSFNSSQILMRDYSFDEARVVIKEMVEQLSLKLILSDKATRVIYVGAGYSKDIALPSGASQKLSRGMNTYSDLVKEVLRLYDSTTYREIPIRRLAISFGNVASTQFEQLDLFVENEKVDRERKLQMAMNDIKQRYGKNAIYRGMSLMECATGRERNGLIGGHNAG